MKKQDPVTVELKCTCGKVKGVINKVVPKLGNRVVCYCDDCQAFAHYLHRSQDILDRRGGTDIYQLPPAYVEITEGREEVRCIRLTSKGIYRWYTECCKTPIGNTLTAGWAFIGLVHNFIADPRTRDASLGPVQGECFTAFAIDARPEDKKRAKIPFSLLVKSIVKLASWKINGLNRPSPVFNANGTPIAEPIILKGS